ncbi:hypothetical protein J6590_012840 [Homalodisca vitripennis]|nr:hypothetical protein J6590_012840 [Homalodisca vitripennis]
MSHFISETAKHSTRGATHSRRLRVLWDLGAKPCDWRGRVAQTPRAGPSMHSSPLACPGRRDQTLSLHNRLSSPALINEIELPPSGETEQPSGASVYEFN